MPYAAEDKISEAMIEGGIEITEQEYQEALQAMLEGKKIAIRDGMLRFLSSEKRLYIILKTVRNLKYQKTRMFQMDIQK